MSLLEPDLAWQIHAVGQASSMLDKVEPTDSSPGILTLRQTFPGLLLDAGR